MSDLQHQETTIIQGTQYSVVLLILRSMYRLLIHVHSRLSRGQYLRLEDFVKSSAYHQIVSHLFHTLVEVVRSWVYDSQPFPARKFVFNRTGPCKGPNSMTSPRHIEFKRPELRQASVIGVAYQFFLLVGVISRLGCLIQSFIWFPGSLLERPIVEIR